jgi:hypothetical protein
MPDILRLAGQAAVLAVVAAAVGYFSSRPLYSTIPPSQAQIKVAFTHGGERKEACRKLKPEEIAKLPAKERRANTCVGERLPLMVELALDDSPLLSENLPPTGLRSDAPSMLYRKFTVPPGRHQFTARLRDTNRTAGFDYENTFTVDLAPGQNLAVDFRPDQGGFVVR